MMPIFDDIITSLGIKDLWVEVKKKLAAKAFSPDQKPVPQPTVCDLYKGPHYLWDAEFMRRSERDKALDLLDYSAMGSGNLSAGPKGVTGYCTAILYPSGEVIRYAYASQHEDEVIKGATRNGPFKLENFFQIEDTFGRPTRYIIGNDTGISVDGGRVITQEQADFVCAACDNLTLSRPEISGYAYRDSKYPRTLIVDTNPAPL